MLQLEAMLMSMISAAARDHVEVHAATTITTTGGCHEQGSIFCSEISDYRLIIENERH